MEINEIDEGAWLHVKACARELARIRSMTNTICTDATTPQGVSHNLFSALLDEFDTLKERVATMERDMNHNHDCFKHGCYRTLDKPTPSLAERTYEAVCWCIANEIQVEFLRGNIRASEWHRPFHQAIVEKTFLKAVSAIKQRMNVTSPILAFEDATLGKRVQFYDHEKKVWRDAMVYIIAKSWCDLDTITLHPTEGTDITMTSQAWYEIGVRVRPTSPKETP